MTEAEQVLSPYAQFVLRALAEIAADLERFAGLLLRWNATHNLVSRETIGELWPRHIADSLALLTLIRPTDAVFLDLGSGGGFPAIPLAIALRRTHILVEPNRKKASFLKAVSRELGLSLRVENRRAEQIERTELPQVDAITSRALAPLAELCGLAAPFFSPSTRAIFHKGREHGEELAESRALWHHDVVVTKGIGGDGGVLLTITDLRLK